MQPTLSRGLPWLGTTGNRIVRREDGEPILLHGVNRSGLEYFDAGPDGFFAAAHFSEAEFNTIINGWGANVLRIPFNQEWALHGSAYGTNGDYLAALDHVIESAARRGAYTLLDLHWLDARHPFGKLKDGHQNFVPPLPNAETPELWRVLAERYRREPAVLFDLLNEPHSRLPSDDRPLQLVSPAGTIVPALPKRKRVTTAEWRPWTLHLIDLIRRIHPDALIFVSGVEWGIDLRGMDLGHDHIVYSAHVYPGRAPRQWERLFGHMGESRPLFLAEWGGGAEDLDWGRNLLEFAAARCCGWTAWSWMDQPHLVHDARRADYQPTAFGELVKQALTRHREQRSMSRFARA